MKSQWLSILAGAVCCLSPALAIEPPISPPTEARAPESPSGMSLESSREFIGRKQGLVIDTRGDVAFQRGHIPGALSLPFSRFQAVYAHLRTALEADKARPILVYCAGETCKSSESVRALLIEKGFSRVSVFPGGWREWQAAGLPEEKSTQGVDTPLAPWKPAASTDH